MVPFCRLVSSFGSQPCRPQSSGYITALTTVRTKTLAPRPTTVRATINASPSREGYSTVYRAPAPWFTGMGVAVPSTTGSSASPAHMPATVATTRHVSPRAGVHRGGAGYASSSSAADSGAPHGHASIHASRVTDTDTSGSSSAQATTRPTSRSSTVCMPR